MASGACLEVFYDNGPEVVLAECSHLFLLQVLHRIPHRALRNSGTG